MSTRYRFGSEANAHFVTCTIRDWVDIFTREVFREIVRESLIYCQQSKGLEIFAYCLMTNHIHLIVRCQAPFVIQWVLRDFKSFTAMKIHKLLLDPDLKESRKEWFGYHFMDKDSGRFSLWEIENHPVELFSEAVFHQKMDYIHLNPLRSGFVAFEEDWPYSSAFKGKPWITVHDY
jgi:REP element-mobilizing transposase RayT